MKADSCGMTAAAYAEKVLCEAGGLAAAIIEKLKNAGAPAWPRGIRNWAWTGDAP